MYRPKRSFALFFTLGILVLAAVPIKAQSYFRNWPAGSSPQEVGRRVAENFIARKLEVEERKRNFVIYPEACAWYGSLTVAQLTKDQSLRQRLIEKFDPLLGTRANQISPDAHVDYRVIGIIPLEIYKQTKGQPYLKLGLGLADKQWDNPTPDGITAEARYWIDDMYMITAVQAQAYRATNNQKYLQRAALTMAAYLDKLQQANGLFFHAADSPFYWGRGNGWVAAGMAELLRSLPAKNFHRARILKGYRTMMAALLKYQGEDGLWRQLIDQESWPETSSTGMFTFAMVTGVKHGWLPAKIYGPAARKAWLALTKRIDAQANITDVCVGTNKAHLEVGADPATQLKYYLDRTRRTGDLHGQAPLLWTATALMR